MSKYTNMLDCFKDFIKSDNSYDMYVTGRAGTGKTTELYHTVQYCIDNNISYIVCAFTHDACRILRSKLPQGANVSTFHSFLKKRPTVNSEATEAKRITTNVVMALSEKYQVCIVDEYSQIGERDRMDLQLLQETEEEYDEDDNLIKCEVGLRVMWIGDMHQLPPVGDAAAVFPQGPFQVKLNKQYRLTKDNPLAEPINQVVSFIEGKKPEPLTTSEHFVRGIDIKQGYIDCEKDKILLAFTNKHVQKLNAEIQGRVEPEPGDLLFCPTLRETFTYIADVPSYLVHSLTTCTREVLKLGSKYKTLEFLIGTQYKFCEVEDVEGEIHVLCYVFGHGDYQAEDKVLKSAAAGSNKAIVDKHKTKASDWAKENSGSSLASARAIAWKRFLAFDQNVVCLDFAHAKTVHKSQGSTYHSVFLDTEDLGIAADFNYTLYLKLMYVGMSRASHYVYTN
jgi:hypothetical protein